MNTANLKINKTKWEQFQKELIYLSCIIRKRIPTIKQLNQCMGWPAAQNATEFAPLHNTFCGFINTLRLAEMKDKKEETLWWSPEWDPAPSVSTGLHCYSDFKTLFTMLSLRFVSVGAFPKKDLSFPGTLSVLLLKKKKTNLKRVKICRAFDLHLECGKFRVSNGHGILATILYQRVPAR